MPSGRGDTAEIKNSGPTSTAIWASGIWPSGGCRIYPDIRADEAGNLSAMLIHALDTGRDGPGEVDKPSKPGNVMRRLRKRMTTPPMASIGENPPRKQDVIRVDGELHSVNSETAYKSS